MQAQGFDPRIAMDMDGPLWSLGYEFWFYVLAGLTALAILRRGVSPAVGIVALMAAPLVADNARFYGFLIIWCLGAVWFVALTSGIDAARLARWALIAAAGFVLAAAAALVVGGPRVANPHYTGAEFVFQTAVVGLGSIALAAYLRRSTARAPRTMRAVASTAASCTRPTWWTFRRCSCSSHSRIRSSRRDRSSTASLSRSSSRRSSSSPRARSRSSPRTGGAGRGWASVW